jgi:hypothetical protein
MLSPVRPHFALPGQLRPARALAWLARPKFLAWCFLLFGLPTGLGCALLAPVGMFPDEMAHAARADGLRHGEILGRHPPPGFPDFMINSGVTVDNGIFAVLFTREFIDAFPDKPVSAVDRRTVESMPWFTGMSYFPTQMVEYFPIMYVPAALGLAAGQSLGATPLHTYYLGRIAMLIAYLAAGTAAIGLARFGNGLIFAVLTLPTAINLASSYNQDGLIIAACALAVAQLTRARAGFDRFWFAALVLLTAVVSAKTPYAALLGLCLPPLLAPGIAGRLALVLLACVPPGLWLLHSIHFGFIPYQRPPYHPGPLWPGPPGLTLHDVQLRYNARVLLAHPVQIVALPVSSLIKFWKLDWPLMLGMISCDTVHIAAWEYGLLATALLTAAAGALCPRPGSWGRIDAGFAALAVFAAFCGMEIAMYLTFSRAGYAWVEGVQSRYFLPLLPFFVLFLPCAGRALARLPWSARWPVPAEGWFYLPSVAMFIVNSYALPAYIFHLFRMPGP